jgi:hypothetical protein
MKLIVVALTLLCLSASGADKKAKPPDLQIVQMDVKRNGAEASIDGRVRATGEKPLLKLTLAFEFRGPGKVVLTNKRTPVDDADMLEPGEEGALHVATACPEKAVDYIVKAYVEGFREIKVANPGPYQVIDE